MANLQTADDTKNAPQVKAPPPRCSRAVARFLKGEDVSDENWSCNEDGSARKVILVYDSEEAADQYVVPSGNKMGERSLGAGWTSMTINTPADVQALLDTRPELKYISESGTSRLCQGPRSFVGGKIQAPPSDFEPEPPTPGLQFSSAFGVWIDNTANLYPSINIS